MSEQQAPSFKTEGNYHLKACPRPGCGGDVGRFQEMDGPVLKCLSCSREVSIRELD